MKLRNLPHLYGARVRTHPISELLAMLGIATGVALVFAVQVANSSIFGSVEDLAKGVAGRATLELAARSPQGFDASTLERVKRLTGVRSAAPVLEVRARIVGPQDSEPVSLVGADPSLAGLGGSLLHEFASPNFVFLRGVALPEPMARRVGVAVGDEVTLQVAGRAVRAPVATLLGSGEVGALAQNPIVPGPLKYLQDVTGMRGRISRILVAPEPGQEVEVQRGLRRVAAGRMHVRPSDSESRLLRDAGAPNSQSTGLFAAISALVGFLFAFNAMLLTAPERRRFISELRLNGHDERTVVKILLFDGLVLGIAASVVGLLLGDQLSKHLFDPDPGYLSFAFSIGDQRTVTPEAIALAVVSGVGGAILANTRPLGDLFSRRPVDSIVRTNEDPAASPLALRTLLAGAVVLVLGATLIGIFAPAAAIVGIVLLVGGMLLSVAVALPPILRVLASLARRTRFPMLVISIGELRSSTLRAGALAGTAALAVFGAVAIGGARLDLLRGLYEVDDEFAASADVWVTAGRDENVLTTGQFMPSHDQLNALEESPVVADLRVYRGAFLDMLGRRVWVMARPRGDQSWIPATQLVEGNLDLATRRLRAGGWAAIAEGMADQTGAKIGQVITVPTPSGPANFRIAAIVGNFGWAPGTLILNADAYRQRWLTPDVAGLEVDLKPGTATTVGKEAVAKALGPGSPLLVESAHERAGRFKRLARQGLDRLNQISTLVLIAAVLALAAAMGGVLWQRRPRLAGMKLTGFHETQVWRALLLETAVVLSIGCLIGAAFGLYGQGLLDRALQVVLGFPVQYSPAVPLAVAIVVGVALVATGMAGLPGYLAAQVPPANGFQEE